MVTGMAKCKDCLHYEACSNFSKIINSAVDVETGCEHFKNRIDVAELVRCKDCKYRKKKVCGNPTAGMWVGVELRENDYCSYGERKSDG